MLQYVKLRNFKCYEEAEFQLGSKLTLIYGRNSSGKSTLFQSLMALKQSWEGALSGFLRLRPQGKYVNLGHFRNVLRRATTSDESAPTSLEIELGTPRVVMQYQAPELGVHGRLASVVVSGLKLVPDEYEDGVAKLRIDPESLRDLDLSELDDEIRTRCRAVFAFLEGPGASRVKVCMHIDDHLGVWKLGTSSVFTNDDGGQLAGQFSHFSTGWLELVGPDEVGPLGRLLRQKLDGLFKIRNEVVRTDHVGPVRAPGRRIYENPDRITKFVGFDGADFVGLLSSVPGLIEVVNDRLGRLGMEHTISLEPRGLTGDALELILDARESESESSMELGLPDVGFGTSQLLPIVTQVVFDEQHASDGALLIEQPELHVNPHWSRSLADFFLGLFNPETGYDDERQSPATLPRTLITETHDDMMVNRISRLILSGEIDADWVRIVVVSRTDGRSIATMIGLDGTTGRFTNPWPDGFFNERWEV
ncbi:MAG: AAA family ATPase [Deltaproteobacteria bacterium]|nr:AAA family ATPase [Deltaproteobacteria bacterium]